MLFSEGVAKLRVLCEDPAITSSVVRGTMDEGTAGEGAAKLRVLCEDQVRGPGNHGPWIRDRIRG